MECRDGDRTRCLSALTQKKGDLTAEETDAVLRGGLVWGCDTCQLACPHNLRVIREGHDTSIPYFTDDRLTRLDSGILSAMPDEAFSSRAYAWRGRKVISRNMSLFEEERRDSRPDSIPHLAERSSQP
jgi:epoxyqueuosine reductase QueG